MPDEPKPILIRTDWRSLAGAAAVVTFLWLGASGVNAWVQSISERAVRTAIVKQLENDGVISRRVEDRLDAHDANRLKVIEETRAKLELATQAQWLTLQSRLEKIESKLDVVLASGGK